MTPRTYRPSRLDRALWSLQLVILVVFVAAFAIAFVLGMAGSSTEPTNPTDLPIGVVVGGTFWIAWIAAYIVSSRALVRVGSDGIDVVPYLRGARHLAWADVRQVSVASTSPYAGGIYGVGSWVEVDVSLRDGRGVRLQATRRPKSQRAAVEQIRNEIAVDLAATA